MEVANLLDGFQKIIFDNVPEGLPLMRKISHQMDLIHGPSFPNKTTHKLTPTKVKELNRQIQELLQKGLIQESLSPRAVPKVPAMKKNGEWRMCTNS